jgi:hypothetical protein
MCELNNGIVTHSRSLRTNAHYRLVLRYAACVTGTAMHSALLRRTQYSGPGFRFAWPEQIHEVLTRALPQDPSRS